MCIYICQAYARPCSAVASRLTQLTEYLLPHVLCGQALFGGGLSAYAALRKDDVGTIARNTVGKNANKAALTTYTKAEELNKEYEVTKKVKETTVASIKKVTEELRKNL